MKNQNKNTRADIGKEADANKMSQADKVRLAMGKQMNLDPSYYVNLPEYADCTLFYMNDTNGEVEKWLHLGAGLVHRKSKSLKVWKGFTDREENEYECTPVGADDTGKPIMCYLMVLKTDEYQALRVDPKEAKNAEILKALGTGKQQAGDAVMPNVSGLKTYAPNLPTGGTGFEQNQETHDV